MPSRKELTEEITSLPIQTVLDSEFVTMGNAQVIRTAGGSVLRIIATEQNLAGTKTNGLDLDLRYSFSAGGAGDFTTALNWSHVNNFVFDLSDGDGFQQVTKTPDDRIQWNLNMMCCAG